MVLSIKPHHFVDIITSFGEGKTEFTPHAFGHALHTVAETILSNGGVTVRIELGADDICRPCRHNIEGSCDDTIDTSYRLAAPKSKKEWNLLIDRRWCEQLRIKQDDRMAAWELCERIRNRSDDLTDI